jgi:hypothetical protein
MRKTGAAVYDRRSSFSGVLLACDQGVHFFHSVEESNRAAFPTDIRARRHDIFLQGPEWARFSVLTWSIGWLLCAKITLVLSRFTHLAREIMLGLPIATTLLAAHRPEVAVVRSILNATIFGALCIRLSAPRLPAIPGGISMVTGLLMVPMIGSLHGSGIFQGPADLCSREREFDRRGNKNEKCKMELGWGRFVS